MVNLKHTRHNEHFNLLIDIDIYFKAVLCYSLTELLAWLKTLTKFEAANYNSNYDYYYYFINPLRDILGRRLSAEVSRFWPWVCRRLSYQLIHSCCVRVYFAVKMNTCCTFFYFPSITAFISFLLFTTPLIILLISSQWLPLYLHHLSLWLQAYLCLQTWWDPITVLLTVSARSSATRQQCCWYWVFRCDPDPRRTSDVRSHSLHHAETFFSWLHSRILLLCNWH